MGLRELGPDLPQVKKYLLGLAEGFAKQFVPAVKKIKQKKRIRPGKRGGEDLNPRGYLSKPASTSTQRSFPLINRCCVS
jgi:hypothetical protein